MRYVFALILVVSVSLQAEEPVCLTCHESPPVGESHMPVDTTSIETCTLCHSRETSDPFFKAVHDHARFGLSCDTCHEQKGEVQAP